MARVTANSPLPPVYRLAIFATEAVLLAVWMTLPASLVKRWGSVETMGGMLACYVAIVFAIAFGLAIRRGKFRWSHVHTTIFLFAVSRAMRFFGLFWLAMFLSLLAEASKAVWFPLELGLIVSPVLILGTFVIFLQTVFVSPGDRASWRKFRSVAEDAWAEPLRALADRVGVERSSYVLRVGDEASDRSPGPAAYRMSGRTAEFFFGQDFMACLSPRERLAVFAHELAHHRLNHSRLARRAALVANFVGVAMFTTWLLLLAGDDTKFLEPLAPATFLAWLTCLLLQPLYMAWLRDQERQANELALQMTGDAEAFAAAMTKLADHLGATPPDDAIDAPRRQAKWLHWMFDTHPMLAETLSQTAATSDKRQE
ncbi:MAG: M48 family metalloprotease [Phycisphaerae bacterium]|nr:M48 family metalloprotease [Phycisphaerae bacterium]